MDYGLTVVSGPVEEPVSLDEAKRWLRQDLTDDDADIAALIKAARRRAEAETERALCEQVLAMTLDAFPAADGAIILPRPPVSLITSIAYVDADGVTQTFTDFALDSTRPSSWLLPAYGFSWPATRAQANAVTITFRAGYGGASAVPEDLKVAIKQIVALWYGPGREGVANLGSELPQSARQIFLSYWPGEIA